MKWREPHERWTQHMLKYSHKIKKKENKVQLETPLITSSNHTGLSHSYHSLSAWQQFLPVLTICPCERYHIYQWNTSSAGSEAEPLVSFTKAGFRHNERSIHHRTCGIAVICLAALHLPISPSPSLNWVPLIVCNESIAQLSCVLSGPQIFPLLDVENEERQI